MSETTKGVFEYDAYLKEKMGSVFGVVECRNGDLFITSVPTSFENPDTLRDFKLITKELLYSEAQAIVKLMKGE